MGAYIKYIHVQIIVSSKFVLDLGILFLLNLRTVFCCFETESCLIFSILFFQKKKKSKHHFETVFT